MPRALLVAAAALALLAVLALAGPWRAALALAGVLAVVLAGLGGWRIWRLWRGLRERTARAEAELRRLRAARAEAERVSAERGRLLATVSHELRTPLHGVLGMASLLSKTDLTPEQANYVQAIDASGRLLLSTVNELLEQARAEALEASAGTAPVLKAFDVAQAVEEVCELLSPRAHQKGLDMAVFVHPDISGAWLGDPVRLRQVLLNLIGNAVKFTSRGGVLVRVEPAPARKGVRFAVIDTGPGISPREQARIFEPFTQGAAHTRDGSTGLGLAITRRLVARMGGALRLKSAPGEGSTFSFILPLQPEGREENSARLDGAQVVLAMPDGPTRQALQAYARALGGKVRYLATQEDLHRYFRHARAGAEAEIICDAGFADVLRAGLRNPDLALKLKHTWLLLPPEERMNLRDLLHSGRLAGFLLRPLRRATFMQQFVEHGAQVLLEDAVRQLRTVRAPAPEGKRARKARRKQDVPGAEEPSRLVLLAEDNPVGARIAQVVLQRAGFEVVHARDGEEAVEEMRRRLRKGAPLPLCILMDMHMPRMDGLAATQQIRRLEAAHDAPRTPIVALTASENTEDETRCLAAGMTGFMPKPFDEEELLNLLKEIRTRRARA